jgi:hypothetical protein
MKKNIILLVVGLIVGIVVGIGYMNAFNPPISDAEMQMIEKGLQAQEEESVRAYNEQLAREQEQERPIRLDVEQQYNAIFETYVTAYRITSVVDEVTINKVIFNNGNCTSSIEEPKTCGFGEYVDAYTGANCNVLKVSVVTNKGTWEFEAQ